MKCATGRGLRVLSDSREFERAPSRAADMLCLAAREVLSRKSRKDTLPNPLIWKDLSSERGMLTVRSCQNYMKKELLECARVDDKQFDHKDYWTRVGKPTLTNHKEVLVKEPLLRIVHKVIMGSLVNRAEEGGSELRQGHGDQGNFGYPTYEPPNVSPYPYPYIPYPYPYTHYQGGHYRLGGDDYFTSAMLDFGGSSSGNAVRGSSRGAGFDDDDMDGRLHGIV
ncbi:hypothetical protein Tco_1446841 [Tanacetum coccineum]